MLSGTNDKNRVLQRLQGATDDVVVISPPQQLKQASETKPRSTIPRGERNLAIKKREMALLS